MHLVTIYHYGAHLLFHIECSVKCLSDIVGLIEASVLFSAVSSPTCDLTPQSASGNQEVRVSCSVTVCGNASIPMSITRLGRSVGSGTNIATWTTTAENVRNTDVTCSAKVGNAVNCREGKPDTMITGIVAYRRQAYLNHVNAVYQSRFITM